jgi:hypothetical protein
MRSGLMRTTSSSASASTFRRASSGFTPSLRVAITKYSWSTCVERTAREEAIKS